MSSGSESWDRERRRFPRLPVETPMEVLYARYWDEPARILGTTRDVSEGGVCFFVNRPIPCREIVLHLDYQGMGAEYILGAIVDEYLEPGGDWRYHCQIERSLGSVDPMSMLKLESSTF